MRNKQGFMYINIKKREKMASKIDIELLYTVVGFFLGSLGLLHLESHLISSSLTTSLLLKN